MKLDLVQLKVVAQLRINPGPLAELMR